MNKFLLSRRQFLTCALAAVPSLALANAVTLEPDWLKINRLSLYDQTKSSRFIHISDLHHRDEVGYTDSIIRLIRNEQPDFVCFTGDLVDNTNRVSGALQFIRELGCPVYGIPGNHDYTCVASFHSFESAFAATGGGWLTNRSIVTAQRDIEIFGLEGMVPRQTPSGGAPKRILLTHYPEMADKIRGDRFSLVLAGHSHGGQIRLPFLGPIFLPPGVGRYDHGLFQTPSGPLHVSAGLGTSIIPMRFNCRPEVTVIEI